MLSLISAVCFLNAVMASPILEARQSSSTASVAGPRSTQEIRDIQREFVKAAVNVDPQRILFSNSDDAVVARQILNVSIQAPAGGSTLIPGLDVFAGLGRTDLNLNAGFLNPCSLNIPHIHQDANEFFTVVQGQILGGLILDPKPSDVHRGTNNSTNSTAPIQVVTGDLTTFKGMLFPVNHTHWQFNPTCQPAAFIAAFDHAGPGRTQLPPDFFSVPVDAKLIAAVGGDLAMLDARGFDDFKNSIDPGFAAQIEECVVRCKLPRH